MKIIECPRDAIQGIKHFLPTKAKVSHLNEVLKAGFDTIDFGSFVSAEAIPQMRDTAEVLEQLDLSDTNSKLLAIVANERGAKDACSFKQITYLGYPFSISETFQLRNTKATIAQSVDRVKAIQELCSSSGKQLVIYISMGFGNPYGDEWNAAIVLKWVGQLQLLGIGIFSLADTIGMATPEDVRSIFGEVGKAFTNTEFGVHLHTTADTCLSKIEAAYSAGCRRFDSAILGYGGCPMAADDLVGNLPTDMLIDFLKSKDVPLSVTRESIHSLEDSFRKLIAS